MAPVKVSSPRNQRLPDNRRAMGQADPQNLSSPSPPKTKTHKISTNFDENSEYSDLAEKVFQNINASFEKDDLLDEFDIIPVESKSNRSPVIHEETEHKLALESWCVPYLFTHSYKSFLAIKRKQKSSSSTPPVTEKYGSSKASNLSEFERVQRGLMLSRTVVMLNPDLTIAWNFRREYLPISSRDILESELRLVNLVATRKPKCPEGYSYRRWLILRGMEKDLLNAENMVEWISSETNAIDTPIKRYFSNYHAWNYRLWLIQTILKSSRIFRDQKTLVLERELLSSNNWMIDHVSDYCGYHYRQKLFQFLEDFKVGSESLEIKLKRELLDNAKRIEMFEGHEAQWYHRKAILEELIKKLKLKGNTGIDDLKDNEKELLEGVTSRVVEVSKECSQLNYNLCLKYAKWLNRKFGWDFNKVVSFATVNPVEH